MSDRAAFLRSTVRSVYGRGAVRFDRRADGAVVLTADTHDADQTRELAIIPANEWASIVASLSGPGEDATTHSIALALHTGGVAYDPDAHEHATGPETPA